MYEQDYISREISDDEQVLWRGQPELDNKEIYSKSDYYMLATSLMVLTTVMLIMTKGAKVTSEAVLIGAALFIMTLLAFFCRRFRRKKELAKKQYAVTTKRILIDDDGELNTIEIGDISRIEKQCFSNGNATIKFFCPRQEDIYGAEDNASVPHVYLAFESICDHTKIVRMVEDIKQNTIN